MIFDLNSVDFNQNISIQGIKQMERERERCQKRLLLQYPTPRIHYSYCFSSVTEKDRCNGVNPCYGVDPCYGVSPCYNLPRPPSVAFLIFFHVFWLDLLITI